MEKRIHFFVLVMTISFYLASIPLSAQVLFNRNDIMISTGWKEGPAIKTDITQRESYKDAGWRTKMLRQFPDSDADGDGALSESEAIGYHLWQVRRFTSQGEELSLLDTGVSRWTEYVEMRDGVALPVEVYLPSGNGPWPVVLVRTSRGRINSALDYGNELLRNGYAVVGGDLTPEGDFVNADLLGRREEFQPMDREARFV